MLVGLTARPSFCVHAPSLRVAPSRHSVCVPLPLFDPARGPDDAVAERCAQDPVVSGKNPSAGSAAAVRRVFFVKSFMTSKWARRVVFPR